MLIVNKLTVVKVRYIDVLIYVNVINTFILIYVEAIHFVVVRNIKITIFLTKLHNLVSNFIYFLIFQFDLILKRALCSERWLERSGSQPQKTMNFLS